MESEAAGSKGAPEQRVVPGARRRSRRALLAAVAAAVVLVGGAVFIWPTGIKVELWNCSSVPLRDVVVGFPGASRKIASIRSGGARSVRIRPRGEVHAVNVAFRTPGEQRYEYAVELYLEPNYLGRVLVFVQGPDFQVVAAARIRLLPIAPSDCLTTRVSPVPAEP